MEFSELSETILSGGVAVVPTDTCYGLVCSPFDEKAVSKIYSLKGRPHSKPLPLLSSSLEMAEKYCSIPKNFRASIAGSWPGPLTVVLKKRDGVDFCPLLVENGKVGMRVPDFPLLQNEIFEVGFPLASTSANISSFPPAYSFSEVEKIFGGLADLLVDGGILPKKPPSKVLDFTCAPPREIRP